MSANVGDLYYEVTLELRNLMEAQRQLDRRLGDMERRGERFGGTFKAIASAVTAALSGIAVEALVSKVIAAQRQFDVLFASLKTMTGGADQAGVAWERLVAFAAQTPYSLEQAVQGFTKLKALGLDPSERAMMSYGNTAAAMGKDLSQMIEAVADASIGEFERLKEFGIKAKVQGDDVALTFQGVTTKIKNNADEITNYLIKIGEVQFGGAMSERMKTLDGDISNLEDSLQALYLSVSQSGFGDVIALSVRKASEAIQQATTSIKEGGLTEYFDALKPYITAAEVAAISLAGAITGRLVAAFAASVAQAYASATAIGAATLAANGFTAAMSLMGGPIGIAITALALLALNWDKIAGSAQNAAKISENAAARIAGAQKKSADRATADLQGQLTDAQKGLADTEKKLAAASAKSIYGGTVAPKKDIEELQARRDAYVQAASDIKTAMNGLGGGAGRGKVNPEFVKPAKQGGDIGDWMDKYATKAEKLNQELKKAKEELGADFTPELESRIREKYAEKKGGGGRGSKHQFDESGYLAGLKKSASDGYAEIGLMEEKALHDNNQRLKSKQISEATHQEAVTLIQADFEQKRMDFRLAKMREANSEAEAIRQQDAAAEQAAFEKERALKTQRQSIELGTLRMKADDGGLQDKENYVVAQAQADMAAVEAMRLLDLEGSQVYADQKVAIEAKMQQDIADLRAAANSAAYSSQADIFGSLASIAKDAAGEQSGIYKAMFAASKAFAIADAIVKIQAGIASAAAMPWPLNLGAMASVAAATAGIVSTISSTNMAGGRQYGGPVSANSMYRVNEKGAPEMFTAANGSQYMLPTASGRVTAADQVGGGAVQWNIIVNNNAPGAAVTASVDDQSKTVTLAVNEVASQIRANSGPVWSAMRSSSNVQGRM